MLNTPEQPNQFKTSEDEIDSLKRQIEELKSGSPEGHLETATEVVKEHTKKVPEETLHEEYIYTPSEEEVEKHNSAIFDLPPEEHDQKIIKLLSLAEEKGILNVVKLISKTSDPHLLDDFERALARKITEEVN